MSITLLAAGTASPEGRAARPARVMAPECEVYLYCSCVRGTISMDVAHLLQQENCHAQVIDEGIKAWIKAGGALELAPESDIHHLPRFD